MEDVSPPQAQQAVVDCAIALCPGFHPSALTHSFSAQLAVMGFPLNTQLVFPSDRYGAYDALAVVRFLHEQLSRHAPQDWLTLPITLIGFSAGAVAAMGAALMLEALGGKVQAVFLLDGWGVPIAGRFPTYRLSHDDFTDWSSALLGAGQARFYATPGVDHLDLWRSPQTVPGICFNSAAPDPHLTTALEFLTHSLRQHQSNAG